MDIKSSRVLLIGASGGIGRHIATALLSVGANLILVGRNREKLERVSGPNGAASQPLVIAADITTATGRDNIVDKVVAMPGGINVVINCAGTNRFGFLDGLEPDDIEGIIRTNLVAPVQLIRMLLPELRKQPHARILNVGSTFGAIGFPGFSVYCATKFALRGFSEALRRELADTNIRVSYFAPRATDTELNSPAICSMNNELGVAQDQPEQVAEQVLRALRSDAKEVYLGWPEKFLVKLNAVFPGLVDRALKKQLPVIRRHAGQMRENQFN